MKKVFATLFMFVVLFNSVMAQGKISGYMFGDYYYNIYAPGTAMAFQAFQLRRVYFTYDNDISDRFTTRFRLEADQSANASNGVIGVAVKDAYIKWKNIFSGSDMVFGIQPTLAYEVSETVWGYRPLEKTIMDLRNVLGSRDIGVSLKGNILENGTVGYWLMVANGNSNKPENDKYKRYYAGLQVKPIPGLQATVHVDYKDQTDVANTYDFGRKVSNGQLTSSLFVGYKQQDVFSVGMEGFLQSLANGYDDGTSLITKSSMGISLFASYTLLPELAAVGRADYSDTNTNSKSVGDAVNYLLFGVSWKADKNVSIIPNLVYERYEASAGRGEPDPLVSFRTTLFYTFL